MIIGLGIDILETMRIKRLIERYGNRFLERWFSAGEIEYCMGKQKPYLHFAARMAAKEAAAKAISIESGRSIPWRHITIAKNPAGSPEISLSGRPMERAAELGIKSLRLSMSHCEKYATASVIAE